MARLAFLLPCILCMGGQALWLTVERGTQKSSESSASKVKAMFFDVNSCLMGSANLRKLAQEGAQVCQHPFSCNNFWAQEVNVEVMTSSFCFLNAYEQNTPAEARKPLDDAYSTYLHNVVSPLWETQMNAVSLETGHNGQQSSFRQVDCDAEQSSGKRLQCMVTQMKNFFKSHHGKPNLGDLNLSTEGAAKMQSSLRRLHSGLVQLDMSAQQKLGALEQGPGDLSSLEFGPEDDVPIQGPLSTSLINPPSKSRYGHVQKGLEMPGKLLTDIDPLAKCNDGSPAIYYMAEGAKDKFHLHLGGGYFCYNGRNCRKRARISPMLASSAGYEMHFTGSGIFDPTNGGLPGWTHGTISYCSSDAYFGQVDKPDFQMVSNTFITEGTTGTHFRGYTMQQAMLKKYVQMGLGSGPNHELVISGCSAGSIGVTAQSDSYLPRVAAIFKEVNPSGTFYPPDIVTVSDNMPMLSPKPLIINFNGELELFDQAMELVNHLYIQPGILAKAGEFLNTHCTASFAENPAACVFPDRVMPFIQTKNFVISNLWDTFTLFNPAGFFQPATPEDEAFAYKIDQDTRAVVNKVAPNQNQWSIGCNDHCFTLNPWWWRLTPSSAPNGMHTVTPKDMFFMTMKGETGKIAMDDCLTFNCGCVGHAEFYVLTGMMQMMTQAKYKREHANEYTPR